jgi:hypothetical protein
MYWKLTGFGALYILFFVLSVSLEAQKPLEHKKRIYVSPEGKMYVQKSKPVYLRISTSPDEDAKSYLLKSNSSSKYTNPMYFDTEGWNTIRTPWAVDTSTREPVYPQQEIIFEIYADSKPPATRISFSEKNFCEDKGIRYYGNKLRVELTANDALSGTEQIFYSLNGKSYQPYDGPISFENEKAYTLKYYSIDRVRNIEDPDSIKLRLDLSAPETQYSFAGKSKKNILSEDAVIKLASRDNLSGVKEIRYSVNDGTEKVYNQPIPVSNFNQDENRLVFYAVDRVNNQEEKQSLTSSLKSSSGNGEGNGEGGFSFYIDKEPPEINLEISGDQHDGKYLFVSERSKITLNAKDGKSGVKEINYSINNSSLSETYSKPFVFPEEGVGYLNYAASDQVGNKSPRKSKAIYKDTGMPHSDINYSGVYYLNRDTLFVKKDTRFTIKSGDDESGVGKVFYRLDQEETKIYNEPVTVKEPGFHNLFYFAQDNVMNRESENKIDIFVDNQPPVIYPHFGSESIGKKEVRGETYTIYPSNAKLYIGATDKASGTEHIEYRINGGKIKKRIPIRKFKPGNYEVEIYAYDQLKNKNVHTIKFAIEH